MPSRPEAEAWIDAVREATDIVEVVGRWVVLRRKGRHWWGLCPFHREKTPSFSVDPDRQLFYCFGCHAGGTVFTFLSRMTGKSFWDVVQELAEAAGVPVPAQVGGGARAEGARRLRQVLEWAQEFFVEHRARHRHLVAEALAARGIGEAWADRFQLGYAPDGWDGLWQMLQRRGVSAAEAEAAGVVVRRQAGEGVYDRWRHRLMFPIRDAHGRLVGFGGRALRADQEPKYLNSPETALFHKGRVLFGLEVAKPAIGPGRPPLLVEGYFDVVACHAAGLSQAVATLGTSLTEYQARLLAKLGAEVDLLYDRDDAGRAAAARAFLVLSAAGLRVNRVDLPAGKDPDECRRVAGDAALVQAVANRRPFVAAALAELEGVGGIRERAERFQAIRPLVEAVPDPIERVGYLESAARVLHMDPSILTQGFEGAQGEKHTSGKNRHNMVRTKPVLPSVVSQLVATLIRHPEEVPRVLAELPEWQADPVWGRLLSSIAAGEAADPARWLDALPAAAQPWAAEALAWDGPDGGSQAVADYLRALRAEADFRRWQGLQERIRRGDETEDVLTEIRELAGRLQRHKVRRGGL
ncbi:MAG: DNA primase [Firmicutes bacterium]|nr:DNA primase [Alicyclobacillaceae bacterium]MCL6496925.1 DNA primase [Bacillota bacterium]